MGRVIDSFDVAEKGYDGMYNAAKKICVFCVIGAAVVWVLSYLYFGLWAVISEKVGYAFKVRYMEAVLRMESAWFDKENVESIATKMSSEIKCV